MKKHFIAACVAVLAIASIEAQETGRQRHPHLSAPERLMALAENGASVTLRLESGKTVELPSRSVHIIDLSVPQEGKRHQKRRGVSTAKLSKMSLSGSLPAVTTLVYRPDGSVRIARVTVFASSDATTAFLRGEKAAKQ